MTAGVRSDIVMLAGENLTSWIVYNRLVQVYGPFTILVEPRIQRRRLLRNRVRKLGLKATLSQMAFATLARPFLLRHGAARSREICQMIGLEAAEPVGSHICKIPSVNSPACRDALVALQPKVVIVNGTRIIKRDTLQAVKATFINIHQGITPQYRGAHGAYWALYTNDRAHCGVTIHLVDEGIDTGGVVHQALIDPQPADNFMTYPLLQTAAALDGLVAAVSDALKGTLAVKKVRGPSAVWYHPGLRQYLWGRLRGIK